MEGNVFSHVCLFVGGPMWPLPMVHWTLLYSPLTLAHSPWRHETLLDLDPPFPLLVTSAGHHWRPFEDSSFQDTTPWSWHLVAIKTCTVGTSRQYASHWNAFLYYWYFSDICWFLWKSICHICQWNHWNTLRFISITNSHVEYNNTLE